MRTGIILATMVGICVIFFLYIFLAFSLFNLAWALVCIHFIWFAAMWFGYYYLFHLCLRCFRSRSFLSRVVNSMQMYYMEYAVVYVLSRDRTKSEQHINGINTQMKYPLNLANVNWFEHVCKRSFMLHNQFCWKHTMALLRFGRCGFDSRFGSIRS